MWKEEAESRFQRLSEKLKDLAQARHEKMKVSWVPPKVCGVRYNGRVTGVPGAGRRGRPGE